MVVEKEDMAEAGLTCHSMPGTFATPDEDPSQPADRISTPESNTDHQDNAAVGRNVQMVDIEDAATVLASKPAHDGEIARTDSSSKYGASHPLLSKNNAWWLSE